MSSTTPLIELSHCSILFDQHPALQDISFTLRHGERWLLIGGNGAGKSLLLKLLRGDMWPTPTGRESRHYHLADKHSIEPLQHKQHIAYLSPERQDKYVRYEWQLSVLQVVTTGLFDEDIPLSKPNAAQQRRVQRLLRSFKLWSLRDRPILSLSYGQRRRVLMARLLIARPKVLLLDEIFNGLDASTRHHLKRTLEATRTATWILATHSAQDIPDNVTHVAQLEQGRLVYAGPILAEHRQLIRRDQPRRHRLAQRQIANNRVTHKVTGQGGLLLRLSQVCLYRDYRPVLRSFDWQVARGEHWAIVGANGSGKSTLLMLIYGDLHPALGGSIERAGVVAGAPISTWKLQVGYVSPELQADYFRASSIEQVIASGRYASIGLNQPLSAADRRAVKPWLRFFGLEALRERAPRQVSYGQLRLALLARAMVNKPRLLLLDEPFTGLDPALHAYVMAALQRLAQAGTQLIIAVHDVADLSPVISKVLQILPGGQVLTMRRSDFNPTLVMQSG
jgi:molybdate transport system ATP-binding protein